MRSNATRSVCVCVRVCVCARARKYIMRGERVVFGLRAEVDWMYGGGEGGGRLEKPVSPWPKVCMCVVCVLCHRFMCVLHLTVSMRMNELHIARRHATKPKIRVCVCVCLCRSCAPPSATGIRTHIRFVDTNMWCTLCPKTRHFPYVHTHKFAHRYTYTHTLLPAAII